MIDDNSIVAAIEAAVQKSIESAIDSQFRSYGHITKQIEEAMENGLRINARDLPFESYNEQMLVIIKSRLGDMFKGAASERFIKEIDKTLKPAPVEMTAQCLIESIVQFWKTDEPWNADDLDEYASVEFEKHEGFSGYTLKMWKQKEMPHYRLSTTARSEDLHLYLSDDGIRINHRFSYNPTCFHEHEAFIFKLYAAGTKITELEGFDPDYCDLLLKECSC